MLWYNIDEYIHATQPWTLTSNEFFWAAHVQKPVHAEMSHQRFEAVGLRVRVVLGQVEVVVFVYEVAQDVSDGLVHVPDVPLISVSDHKHPMRDFAVSRSREERHAVQMVADGAVHGHCQRAECALGRQDPNKQALANPQLRADVFSSAGKKWKILARMRTLKNAH